MAICVLIANRQKDIEFQYADFGIDSDKKALLFKFNRIRIGIIRVLDLLRIKNTIISYVFFFRFVFYSTIDREMLNHKQEEILFIVLARAYEKYGRYLVKHIKNNYPKSKVALYLGDLSFNMRFLLDDARKDFDVICSFDEEDSKRNGFQYVQEPCSVLNLNRIKKKDNPCYDVTFVGGARNRYEKIITIYEELVRRGFKCDFHVVGVPKRKRVHSKEIQYGWLDFYEVLQHVENSYCVLEIMQQGGFSATARFAEAMLMGKKLLTDCPELKNDMTGNVIYFSELENINYDSIRKKTTTSDYVNKFSVESFVKSIYSIIRNNS